jgi:cobalt-zinc-cadmium efflux system outer membrane protein
MSLYQSWRATHSKMLIYEQTLLPKAQQVATQAELAYQKGALPLTDLLEARRTLRATRLEGLMAKLEHAKAQGLWQLNTNAL